MPKYYQGWEWEVSNWMMRYYPLATKQSVYYSTCIHLSPHNTFSAYTNPPDYKEEGLTGLLEDFFKDFTNPTKAELISFEIESGICWRVFKEGLALATLYKNIYEVYDDKGSGYNLSRLGFF